MKNKRQVEKGKNGPVYAWLLPAGQRAKENVADMVNELRKQGLEVSQATSDFKAGATSRGRGRLCRARRSALPHFGRHVLRRAELPG